MLQEIRINRVVRRFHASTGKRATAHDEFLEHGNRFLCEFPLPRSLASFEEQSNYSALGMATRTFTDNWYSSISIGADTKKPYASNVAPTMTPEKKMIYQIFKLLRTHEADYRRVIFKKNYVSSIEDDIDVELRRETLENAMHKAPETQADEILKSLTQVYDESIKNIGANLAKDGDDGEDGELSKEDAAEFAGEGEDIDTSYFVSEATQSMSKKTINKTIYMNPWTCGNESFAKKTNVVDVRAKACEIRKKKSAARKAILTRISEENGDGVDVLPGMEVDGLPHWHRYTRSVENNLGLK